MKGVSCGTFPVYLPEESFDDKVLLAGSTELLSQLSRALDGCGREQLLPQGVEMVREVITVCAMRKQTTTKGILLLIQTNNRCTHSVTVPSDLDCVLLLAPRVVA